MKRSVAILMLLWAGTCSLGHANEVGPVRLSEAYELANIVLALTDYGKTDPWEVERQSAYYREVRAHFDRYAHHPLLAKVNYSREKWESYLSFRTDAYAFTFDPQNRLVRMVNFHTNKGFDPFGENLDLVNDFARMSGFRQFYQAHLPYYQTLATTYLKSQHYPDMVRFLETELGNPGELTAYAIVLSPLVGRMNCHRIVAGTGTDFITLPGFLLDGKLVQQATPEEVASGMHMLFTELDHAFVNPVTDQYRALVSTNFDTRLWDEGSGYETDSLATFNEYMTWAVYDLYVQTHFPRVADRVSRDWALQNATRGFFASSAFNQELTRLYNARKPGQKLKDLYPALVRQLGILQRSLNKPLITASTCTKQSLTDTVAACVIHFSEPMQELRSLDVVRVVEVAGKVRRDRLDLTPEANAVTWADQGRTLRFTLTLATGGPNDLIVNYPWQTRTTLRSIRGVDLKPYSRVSVKVANDR